MKEKIGRLGKPTLVFGPGQRKRLELIKRYLSLKGKKILDIGCGIGVYANEFFKEGAKVYGIDIDKENIELALKSNPNLNLQIARAEALPFKDKFFDIVFLNEILEHVEDDKKTILEAYRVLKPKGKMIIFAPNRLYPFETHGIYLGKKYIYHLIPFINWFPKKIRDFFCPHVRVYTKNEIKKLFKDLKIKFLILDCVLPALDKFTFYRPKLGGILKKILNYLGKNYFFRQFGISIFAILEKFE